ncbi:leucine-rich repeat protein [Clostridium sp. MCC353]|uniref:leucine-rich repeat domain-containing protein n=1 Tax=Clostridium sp. MCC353 TaxID=2592646 RepID=UPI001C02C86B|nr:leucine-rich repeat domain-containing protein [Clostridium sp. MCC353]MBT9777901.1 leucine-rich repeat protein [Clostridium sp. MCC353]
MEFEYEESGGQIRIIKCLTEDTVVTIPETIDGKIVSELGKYALSGHKLKTLQLPAGIRKIGAYALYNCGNLKNISFYSTIEDIGAGVFTGCTAVEVLDVTVVPGQKSCLKEVLFELRQTLYVRYHGQQEARLIFTEFYEESIENTPARITGNQTHGCGHRYRYCFQNTEFQFRDYDSLFPHLKVQEAEELTVDVVMGRLMYPLGLTMEHKGAYEAYLSEHMVTAGRIAARREWPGDSLMERLIWFTQNYVRDVKIAEMMTEEARRTGNAGATSYLMDFSHTRFAGKRTVRRKFEL